MSIIEKLTEPKITIPEERKRFSNGDLKALIVPIIIEQLLALLVGLADTMMISNAGEAAVSGVSLVNQLATVFIMVFTALATGGTVIASQYVGSGDREKGIEASGQLVMITTVISFVTTAVLLLFGGGIFSALFGAVESDVYEAGMVYLRITAVSFPFLALYNGCAGLYRSMGKTKVLMYVSIVMNVINVGGNYIGIYVMHAGVLGAAYPTLISRAVAAVIMLYLAKNPANTLYITVKGVISWHWDMVVRIFRVAVPNSIESGLFQVSKVALSSMVALFGTTQIAANGVAQSFWSLAALFCIAMGPAFITVIGQYTGAGDMEGAEYYMKKLLRITMLGAILWNAVVLMMVPLLLGLFELSDECSRLVWIMCILHNVFNGFICPTAFAQSNGLRAAGDIRYTMYSALFATCVVRVALSYILGVLCGMGAIGITLGMVADWFVKGALIRIRFMTGKWKTFKLI